MLDDLFSTLDAPALFEWLARFFMYGAVVLLAVVCVAGLIDVMLTTLRGPHGHEEHPQVAGP
ncbi:MAG TPA: hypothetical protein VFZ11_12625 [Gemmatimonadaceae bacterium]